jgi:hypothetical protein
MQRLVPKASALEQLMPRANLQITNAHTNHNLTVLWKITPLFANWISSPQNLLARCGITSKESCVLELGCGISGLVSLALTSKVKKYVNTDQEYVLQLVRQNVDENLELFTPNAGHKQGRHSHSKQDKKPALKSRATDDGYAVGNILTRPLDWETSDISGLYKGVGIEHLDILISCDCIYNDALISPLNTTMRDICRLASELEKPTVVVVAQQLRAPDVLEAWLKSFIQWFRVWRVPEHELDAELREGSGYVVHVGVLRSQNL